MIFVRVSSAVKVFPLVQASGMAKGCFSLESTLLSLDIRFDLDGLLRLLELTVGVPLLHAALPQPLTAGREPTDPTTAASGPAEPSMSQHTQIAKSGSRGPTPASTGAVAPTEKALEKVGDLPGVALLRAELERPLESVLTTGLFRN